MQLLPSLTASFLIGMALTIGFRRWSMSRSLSGSLVPHRRHKLLLLVRQDLKMSAGKKCAQCCHAAVGVVRQLLKTPGGTERLNVWERFGEAKIAVQVESEKELLDVVRRAEDAGLPTYVVQDAGHTQVPAGAITVAAIGPAVSDQVDVITGHLRLL